MDAYTTEQEQVEQIKKWWNENGKAIVFGLVIGLGGLFGYRYWDAARIAEGQAASINYEHFLSVASAGTSDEARAAGQAIIDGYPKSTYAKLSALVLAKVAVDAQDFDEAKSRLQWVIDNSDGSNIKPIAQSRRVQILVAQNELEAAAAGLADIDSAHADRFSELRGDVLVAQGNLDQARTMYDKALEDARERGSSGGAIQLKLDNLALGHR